MQRLAVTEIMTIPATGYTTALMTGSAAWSTYFEKITVYVGISATLVGIVLSLIIIRATLTKHKNDKLAELDRQAMNALQMRKIEFEFEQIKYTARKAKKCQQQDSA
jgi:hypothetical protein